MPIYGIEEWKDAEDFMEQLAIRSGKLVKGGDANLDAIARLLVRDWQRGKIPFMVHPSQRQIEEAEKVEKPVYNPALM